MNEVRVGVIGIGNMGRLHALDLKQGKVKMPAFLRCATSIQRRFNGPKNIWR